METKTCSICANSLALELFELDSRRPDGHGPRCKQCIRERRIRDTKYPKSQPQTIINSDGQPVVVKHSSQILVIKRGSSSGRYRTLAYVNCTVRKSTGALRSFREKITFCRQPYSSPERIAQELSAENIHLAMYRLGFGIENQKLDKAKLHSWNSESDMLQEYDGLAIKQFGLRRDD